ncbi:LuxR C-terminal-related transcriptional regulator [Kitasatospora sp. A2-31]|uniref:LuxR C-terminal-related transcriptional regulator n=1 Tax=Kitasatospora sp. A2-31 TaxID=2916414 RepID=UPI0027E2A5EB|nr:LuxR C-terminal-related transcriptional regulator [Kitasatospora sp. A2-31]
MHVAGRPSDEERCAFPQPVARPATAPDCPSATPPGRALVAAPADASPIPPSPAQLDGKAVFWRNRAALLFDRIPLPLLFCDAHGTVLAANHALATEWDTLPGRLSGRNALELFRPSTPGRLHPLAEAVRLRRRSRYPVEVSWTTANGADRFGEMTVNVVSDEPDASLNLLLIVRPHDRPATATAPAPAAAARASALEARILALAAAGNTSARIAGEVGLTADGVNYHLTRLSRRWGATNRTALIARAYVNGTLAPDTWPPAPAGGPRPTGDR